MRVVYQWCPEQPDRPFLSVHEIDGHLTVTVRGAAPFGSSDGISAAVLLPDEEFKKLVVAMNTEFAQRTRTLREAPVPNGGDAA